MKLKNINSHIIPKSYNYYNLNTSLNYNIISVYFINCLCNKNYLSWFRNQINIIKDFSNKIYIVCVATNDIINIINNVILCNYSQINIEIEFHDLNEYEYRGILKVWEISKIYTLSTDIILYLHSKGMTRVNSFDDCKNDYYYKIFEDINKIKEIFNIFYKINKIGYFCSNSGFIWYNFWFVRGSYIKNVIKPIKTNRRHYYESWLCLTETKRKNDCYNFIKYNKIPNICSYYDPNKNELNYKLKKIIFNNNLV